MQGKTWITRAQPIFLLFLIIEPTLFGLGCNSRPVIFPDADQGLLDQGHPAQPFLDGQSDESTAPLPDTGMADSTNDMSKCGICSVSLESDYIVGWKSPYYYIAKLAFGPAMRSGSYTLYTPPILAPTAEPLMREIQLRQGSITIASTSFHWGTTIWDTTPVELTFADYLIVTVAMVRPGSMNLFGLWQLFDGSTQLVVTCPPCTP